MRKLQPLQHRIVIKKLDESGITKGGIVIPDVAKEKSTKGTVVAVGPGEWKNGKEHKCLHLKAGDTVLYSKYAGIDVELDGEEYFIINYDDVLAKLN